MNHDYEGVERQSGPMGSASCRGTVSTLKGQYVQVTGRIHVNGVWWTQAEVKQKVRRMGGDFVSKGSRNKEQTLVIAGELPLHVIDRKNRRSQDIVFVAEERTLGNHICLVDEHGLGQLLGGKPARCIGLVETPKGIRVSRQRTSPASTTDRGEGPLPEDDLGVSVKIRQSPSHRPVQLTLNLDKLDRGTKAHEVTRDRLLKHLASVRVVEGVTPVLFDAGWYCGKGTFVVGEVKSLTSKSAVQQIRLGLGQILEYAQRIRGQRPELSVKPVLVLEKEPPRQGWSDIAESAGVLLTWAPDFPRINPDGTLELGG
jgi:hypothetical protein